MQTYSFVIVSNRLPVSVTKENGKLTFSPSSGGLATAMSSVASDAPKVWIGWPGIASDDLTPADKRTITRKLSDMGCAPVFLTKKQIAGFYDGYANGTLWPLFHYFQHHTLAEAEHWEEYKKVNQQFQKAVHRYADPEATIWVHDYHFMLLPAMLRKALPASTIGFFLHIPFPSYEIFRLLPNRSEILRGLLGADLVGFHTYDYALHFTSSVRKVLGHESKQGTVMLRNRTVKADAFPIGIDYDKFIAALDDPIVKDEMKNLKQRYDGQRLIISVDRLDYSKGILQRLEAFGKFLEQNPAYQKKVSLVVIAVPSRTDVDAYQKLRDDIELAVSRINGMYATMDWSPISYQYTNLPFAQIVALYAMAEVALVTPLRDGMNLVAKEFLASKQSRPGVLILSEMAGAASELPEALRVNPYDSSAIVAAIKEALVMPVPQQRRALRAMQARISQYSVTRWSNDFTEQLRQAKIDSAVLQGLRIDGEIYQAMRTDYLKAKRRLFLLDYDGTLRGYVSSPSANQARPTARLLHVLSQLAADPHNLVCIISGRNRMTLEAWFASVPVLLVAEHGAWLRDGDVWTRSNVDFDTHKEKLIPILTHYAERTPGAVIEEKDFSLVWHYRNVGHELAYDRNSSLRHTASAALKGTDVGIFDGNKIIEIKPRSLQKGIIAQQIEASYPADFIFAAGDDYTDEDMFTALQDTAWTIKVGPGGSHARHRVSEVENFVELLTNLAGIQATEQ
jgi:trehalose 6-phosphate synthase/phosphatase